MREGLIRGDRPRVCEHKRAGGGHLHEGIGSGEAAKILRDAWNTGARVELKVEC